MKKKIFFIFLSAALFLTCAPPIQGGAQSITAVHGEIYKMEAEIPEAELKNPFVRMTDDPDASGGGYVTVSRTGGFNSSQQNSDPGELQYYISVESRKAYYIWARVKALNISSTSVWYRADSGSWSIKRI